MNWYEFNRIRENVLYDLIRIAAQEMRIGINSYAAYRRSYQHRIVLRIPYTNLMRIFGDDP